MIDFMSLTPTQTEHFIHMQSQVARQQNEALKINLYRDYFDGEHPTYLTLRQKEFLGSLLTEAEFTFRHNVCRLIVESFQERLNVSGISIETNESLSSIAWNWWTKNKLESRQADLYRRILRDGKSYVMVDFDNEKSCPRIKLHKLDDGNTGIVLHKDLEDPDKVWFATKYFFSVKNPENANKLSTVPRKTVYLDHEIRKYELDSRGGWIPIMDPGDVSWPIPWVDFEGNPLGVPIFEFENPGGSELEDAIPLQNALNKTWLDLISAADQAGFPVMAIEYKEPLLQEFNTASDSNLTGTDELSWAPGRAIEVEGGTIKRIEAADLEPISNTLWTLAHGIAGISKTPFHYIKPFSSTANLSGETIKQLEAPLVKKVEQKQISFGQIWSDVFLMAFKLNETFGIPTGYNPDSTPDIEWEVAFVEDIKNVAQTAQIYKELGVPDYEVFIQLGYTPEQIEQFAILGEQNVRTSNITEG